MADNTGKQAGRNDASPSLTGTVPIARSATLADTNVGGDSDAASELRSATSEPATNDGGRAQPGIETADAPGTSDAPDTVNTKVEDLPQSNAGTAGAQDQSKVYGAPESTDYSKNPPDLGIVLSTHDRDSVETGPESIGAGGRGNPAPNADGPAALDGNDPTPRGNPDAPQGTGPDVNTRTMSSRERNNVQGKVRQAGDK